MSEPQRRRYLANHPRSRFKTAAVGGILKSASPAQKAGVKKFLRDLSGPEGTLTRKVTERVKVENIKPKDVGAIASTLRAAQAAAGVKAGGADYDNLTPAQKRTWRKHHGVPVTDAGPTTGPANDDSPAVRTPPESGPNPKRKPKAPGEDANDLGYKAGVLTMASVGLLVVGGAALVALGVPLTCFTPDLISEVWKGVRPDRDDETLVHNMCEAIRKRVEKGIPDRDLEGSLNPDSSVGKGAKS